MGQKVKGQQPSDRRGYFYESVGGVYYTLEWPLKSSPPSSSSNHEDLLPSEIPPNDNAISAFQGWKSQNLINFELGCLSKGFFIAKTFKCKGFLL